MRLRKKPLVLTLAVVAALVLLAIAVLWFGARSAAARRAATDYLGELTGLPVSVATMAIGILPTPSLELGGLAVAQPQGFAQEPLLEAGSARVALTWRALFGGDPALRSITISDATLRSAFAADGSDNWSGLIERLSDLGGEGDSRWSIGRFDIERGALEFHDAATDSRWRLTAISIGAESIAPAKDFPVELKLAGAAGDNTFHFGFQGNGLLDPDAGRYAARDLALRGWVGGGSLPLAGIELEGDIGVASFDGSAGVANVSAGTMTIAGIRSEFGLNAGFISESRLDFKVTTAPFSPRTAAAAFGTPLPATADPAAFQTMQLTVNGRLEQGRLHLDPIEGRLDDTNFTGQVVPELRQIRIRADRLDLNQYFAPGKKSAKDKKATLEATIAELGALDIDAEIRIAEARVAGAKLRNTLLKVERDGGSTP